MINKKHMKKNIFVSIWDTTKKQIVSTTKFFIVIAIIVSLSYMYEYNKAAAKERTVLKEKILIGIDGLSYYGFKEAQKIGLFKSFAHLGAHVAPYPSMTDLSWSEVMQTEKLFKSQGRIQSVEAVYFDESTKSIQGDPRDYYRRLAQPKYYMGAFEHFFNPYIEGLMYFPTEEVPKLEIKTVFDELKKSMPKAYHSAYVGAIDSIAHTQKDRLFPLLKYIDSQIIELEADLKRQNRDVEIILVSDHGNIGRFTEGKQETELLPVDLGNFIESTGFNFKQILDLDKDIASPLMALGNWAPLYFKNKAYRLEFVRNVKSQNWFELATYVVANSPKEVRIRINSATEEAELVYDKKTKSYFYFTIKGNPLQVPNEYISSKTISKPITEMKSLLVMAKSHYPDALYRIVNATTNKNYFYPDMILNIKPGYFISNSLSKFTKMYRTHGSLAATSSFGIVASNKSNLPGMIRSKDILNVVSIDVRELFKTQLELDNIARKETIKKVSNNTQGIATLSDDFSQKRIFEFITRFLADSRRYFVIDEIKQMLNAFISHPISSLKSTDNQIKPFIFDFSKFNSTEILNPKDIGSITDTIINSGNIEQALEDKKIQEIQNKLLNKKVNIVSTNSASNIENPQFVTTYKDKIMSSKRMAMKIFQTPYLLEKALNYPEKRYLKETRDLVFASTWNKHQEKYISNIKTLNKSFEGPEYGGPNTYAKRLFSEIRNESEIESKIFPTELEKIYKGNLSENVTIVYVPGIYNSLFDNEIFSLGLDSLKEDLGLRVLKAPIQSGCSTDYNGSILMTFLKKDYQDQLDKGQLNTKYILLGYSKGGVDSLEAILLDRKFTSENILALVSIASPLNGSAILNKTDLPFQLINALSEITIPRICVDEKPASKSITPTRMNQFWRKNKNSLIGITRYFSISFVSEPEDSHLFMKATKQIAQFNEDNDGVVTISSSRFPKELMSVDLGAINADHLAGILSSRFDQKSFMKAIVRTLAEFNIEDTSNNFDYNSQIILANTSIFKDKVFNHISKSVDSYTLDKVELNKARWYLPELTHYIIKNTFDLNQVVIPKFYDPSMDYAPQTKLPTNQIPFDPNETLDVAKLGDIMSHLKVEPLTTRFSPSGIDIEFRHKHMVQFRMDYQFQYESRSPVGNDDNQEYGYLPTTYNGNDLWALMRSKNNSIRMTTMAYRFSPRDFKNMKLKIAVTRGVKGADPVKGKSGIDDSAFQVWFTIREKNTTGDRAILNSKTDNVFMFGYYWGDPTPGENRKPGDIFEDYYSNKNVVVATLPEAKMLLLNSPDMLGKAEEFNRNFYQDLKRAFPNKNVDDFDIVAITIQHDSNDAKDSSEAYFKYLKIMP